MGQFFIPKLCSFLQQDKHNSVCLALKYKYFYVTNFAMVTKQATTKK